jgi:hypothetical protein
MVEFSIKRLEIELLQDENYDGSFEIISNNDVEMRGFIHCSNPRMQCLTPMFCGTRAEICFLFHSEGLLEGDIQKGEFYIICNDGEYNLSFVVTVTKYYPSTTIGKVKNLFEFANLAQFSFEEAHQIFRQPYFINLIKPTETRERILYQGLLDAKDKGAVELEEFLIGIKKKQRITISLSETDLSFHQISQPIREVLEIRKDQWGFIEIVVTVQGDFIKILKENLTSEQFVGNTAKLEFIIENTLLHQGKNFGQITLTSPYQRVTCNICAHPTSPKKEEEKPICKILQHQVMALYMDYRLGRTLTGTWSKEVCICLERLLDGTVTDPNNQLSYLYMLLKAQALLVNKQRQEAEWAMNAFAKRYHQEGTPLWGFYLYLKTLFDPDSANSLKLKNQVQELYHENQDNPLLFWVMLFSDSSLNNSKSRKLQAIEGFISDSLPNSFILIEAFCLISKDIYLLKKAGRFERQILFWSVKHKAMTREIAGQIKNIVGQIRGFDAIWYQILKYAYEITDEPKMLKMLCGYCIQWDCLGQEYFKWYDMGISLGLKIAGLYEAWLLSANQSEIEQFPRTVTLYFQYHNNLDYRKQALLYAGIIRSKEVQRNLYQNYKKNMEQFAIEQLLKTNMDENLAILYEDVLSKNAMSEKVAAAFATILYTHRLICTDGQAKRVIVRHSQLRDEQVVPLINGQAYIKLYTCSYCILLEDGLGRRYAAGITYELVRLLQPSQYLKRCMEATPRKLPYLLHYFDGRKTWQTFLQDDLGKLLYLMESDQISISYQEEMKPQIIEYYYNSYMGEMLDNYLEQIDYEGLNKSAGNQLLELLIARRIYEKAYKMILLRGGEQVSISKLVSVASHQIEKKHDIKDETLLGLSFDIFRRGKYNDRILQYLCHHFQGPLKDLDKLWLAARQFELDTLSLEERYLAQMLYTEGFSPNMSDIFLSCYENNGNERILMACLSSFSYQYFVKDTKIGEAFLVCIGQQLARSNKLNYSCRLAYLKWLSEQKTITDSQLSQMDKLLEELVNKGLCFGFFQELPQSLLRKYHLYDKTFVEYRTNPQSRVTICYGKQEESTLDYVEAEMMPMYEGIFVKEFVLFFGDDIPYYIKEDDAKGSSIVESGHIQCSDPCIQGDESCYDRINEMLISYHLKDEKTLQELMQQYNAIKMTVAKRFQLL